MKDSGIKLWRISLASLTLISCVIIIPSFWTAQALPLELPITRTNQSSGNESRNMSIPSSKQPRIVNGQPASNGQFPFFTNIGSYRNFCGGSFLSRKYVLTAAHCVEDETSISIKDLYVQFGSLEANKGPKVYVRKHFLHPDYNSDVYEYDFAVLELVAEADITEDNFVELDDGSHDLIGETASTMGFGKTQSGTSNYPTFLLYTILDLLPDSDCKNVTDMVSSKGVDFSSMICAGRLGTDSCQGDSGGPLTVSGSNLQVGIVSFGFGCADPSYPTAVYSRVSAVRSWILSIMGESVTTPKPSQIVTTTMSPGPTEISTGSPSPSAAPTSPTPTSTSQPSVPTETPDGSSDSSSCFPADATVLIHGAGVKRMEELQIGDKVLVGNGKYSDVYFFGHKLSRGMYDFVELVLDNGRIIQLSQGHLVRANNQWTRGGDVQLGDMLLDVVENVERPIMQIRLVQKRGLYNPHTLQGEIVVNGIQASSYTDIVHPKLAHMLLLPERLVYVWTNHKMSLLGSRFDVQTPRWARIFGDVITGLSITAS